MSTLRLSLLGEPTVEQNGRFLTLTRRKNLALLAYLAVTNEPHRREALATLFWPEQEAERAYAALRQALWLLRKELGEQWLGGDRDHITLVRHPGFWLDMAQFQQLAAQSSTLPLAALSQAADLYRGPFLQGFTLPDAPLFSEWHYFQSEALQKSCANLLQTAVLRHKQQQDGETAVTYARRWVELDPLDETAQRQLITLYGQLGQRSAALRQYEQLAQRLTDELNATPEAATTALYEQIRQNGRSPHTPDPTPHTPPPPSPTNLPPTPTPFIGRQNSLSHVIQLLTAEPACHLVTIVGAGGIGKTRLAIQTAHQLAPHFRDGTYLVSLAHTNDSKLLFTTIAETIQFAFYGGLPAEEQLLNHLASRHMLLILDNFEHLVGGANALSQLIARAPHAKLLITSRELLHLQEEWSVPMRGMGYPALSDSLTLADLSPYSAVQLFLQRARQSWGQFTLAPGDIPHLLHICQLVDGNPLGLELAAAWVRMMSCAEIAQEIERNLDFLSTSLQNVPERHRSLRAVFEYSWQFLSDQERQVLRQLAVFRGGFDAAAAAEVVGATPHALLALVDKSLVRRTGTGRYDLHTLVRQYGAEKLQTAVSETIATQSRHSHHYAAFTRRCEQQLKGEQQHQALNDLASNRDNMLAGWRWAVANHDLTAVQQYLEGLWLFGEMRGWFQASETLFAQAIASLRRPAPGGHGEKTDPQHQIVLGQLLARQGCAAFRLGFLAQGRSLLEESLAILHPHAPATNREIAFALLWLGVGFPDQPNASEMLNQSHALFEAEGDPWGASFALQCLALLAELEGDFQTSAAYHQEAMAQLARVGDRRLQAFSTNALGRIAQGLGDYSRAAQLLEEALTVRQSFGDRVGMMQSLLALGITAVSQGNYPAANQHLNHSLALSREIHNRVGTANALAHLGVLHRLRGDLAAAHTTLQESLTIANAMNHPRTQALVQQQLGLLAQAQGNLPLAATCLAQSIAISQPSGFETDTTRSLCYQALIHCQLGQPAAARTGLQQVVSLLQPAPALLLLALFAAATLVEQTETGREEEIVGWKTAVFHHPATPHDIRLQLPPVATPATLPTVTQLLQMILAALEA